MLAQKRESHLKICPQILIIGLNLNHTKYLKQTLIVPDFKTLIKPQPLALDDVSN